MKHLAIEDLKNKPIIQAGSGTIPCLLYWFEPIALLKINDKLLGGDIYEFDDCYIVYDHTGRIPSAFEPCSKITSEYNSAAWDAWNRAGEWATASTHEEMESILARYEQDKVRITKEFIQAALAR